MLYHYNKLYSHIGNSEKEKYYHICEESPFKCTIPNCKEEFLRKDLFELHLSTHNSSFHVCMYSKCSAIIVEASLKISRFHEDPLKKIIHTCQICTKIFTRNSSIKRHLLIHSKLKPFHCPNEGCNYQSNQKSNLAKHIKLIHGSKSSELKLSYKSKDLFSKTSQIFTITKIKKKENQLFEGNLNFFDFSIYFQMINERINQLN